MVAFMDFDIKRKPKNKTLVAYIRMASQVERQELQFKNEIIVLLNI